MSYRVLSCLVSFVCPFDCLRVLFLLYLFVCCRREKLLLSSLPCPLQAPLGLHAQKEYSPPPSHTLPLFVHIFMWHAHKSIVTNGKPAFRSHMANMHSGKQPQCILGVVSETGVDFLPLSLPLSRRLCKFALCQLRLLFEAGVEIIS